MTARAHMIFFEHLFRPGLQTGPFTTLRQIKWRAERILEKAKRTPEEIDWAAVKLRSAIEEHNEERAKEEFEKYVRRLYEHGGWELSYLENVDEERGPTLENIRELLEYWPSWADDTPDFVHAEDFDDLDSLRNIWATYHSFDDVLKFGELDEIECYALLALMKLEAAAQLMQVEEKGSSEGSLIHGARPPLAVHMAALVGNLLVEAMEAICYAERELYYSHRTAMLHQYAQRTEAEAQQAQRELEREAESEKARALANIRWAEDAEKREAAKQLIKLYWDIWTNDRSRYKNQGEFARDMEEKIETEIGRTAKQKPLYSANTIEVKLIPMMRNTRVA